jgi:hypothetical protein
MLLEQLAGGSSGWRCDERTDRVNVNVNRVADAQE